MTDSRESESQGDTVIRAKLSWTPDLLPPARHQPGILLPPRVAIAHCPQTGRSVVAQRGTSVHSSHWVAGLGECAFPSHMLLGLPGRNGEGLVQLAKGSSLGTARYLHPGQW